MSRDYYEQLAVDRLRGAGTDRGMALAAEIERGMRRRDPLSKESNPCPEHVELTGTLSEQLEAMRQAVYREQERNRARWDLKSADERQRRETMLAQLRPATPREYSTWVTAFMRSGGRPRYADDRPMSEVYVATSHLKVSPLHGASALEIIVPPGVRDDGGPTGHSELFILNRDGTASYRSFHDNTTPYAVRVYSDTEIID